MSTNEIPDAESVVGQFWPRYGPYTAERTAGAAVTAAELVRYLNHATQLGSSGVPTAMTASRTVGGLQAVAGRMDQVLNQLAGHVQHWREQASLYEDTAEYDDRTAAEARADTTIAALAAAVRASRSLANTLARAQTEMGHLGNPQS